MLIADIAILTSININLNLCFAQVQAFTDLWVNSGRDVIEKLRHRTLVPKQVGSCDIENFL